ncbi:cytochrome c family protein [Zhengella mangrovi]|uniref:Cytochrome c family protein n=1 Tax=Zhengella mangrovi TaxID=1982044 RepID=A0A2G1QUC5_9HYPH|nr:cytochrome c family protein [Zhengella mangrovi]PHP69091.1 cytochrome c family protein [Zhengella mangrovi]
MDSFELNKFIGATLGTVFVVFSLSIASDAIFESHDPEQPGYVIQAAEGGAENTGGEAKDTGPEPVAPLLASADPAEGEKVFKKCAACHTVDKGGANKVGPNLWGVVGRPIASHEGFSYSGSMQEFSQGQSLVWDYDHLNHFLAAPKKYISGTAMGFAGLKKVEDRANLLAWLRTQEDTPYPLPAAGDAAAPAANGDAAAAPAAGDANAAPAEGKTE